jgi:hypothetical protein
MNNAAFWIEQLQLQKHPEGGYYRETYRCQDLLIASYNQEPRSISTAIYFLLQEKEVSHFHRIKSDELWFFHEGETLEILVIENNQVITYRLGKNILQGEQLQVMVPAGCWFASRIRKGEGFSLVSCTVAPGFDFQDFELANREALCSQFPHLSETLAPLCIEN